MPTISNVSKELDLKLSQGSSFALPYRMCIDAEGTPWPLIGYTVRAQIRSKRLSADVAAEFSVEMVDPANGRFVLHLSSDDTAAIPCGELPDSPRSQYVWDVEMESPSGNVTQINHGKCTIHAQVTRP